MNQRIYRTVGVILLMVVLIASASACKSAGSSGETTTVAVTESRKYLSETALIQQIAQTVDGQNEIESTFNTIPERQRQDLTIDQFQRYIQLLRRGVAGQVVSFAAMTPADTTAFREKIYARLPAQNDLAGRTMGYWLNIGDSGMVVDQFAVFCQKNDEGNAYLDRIWIEQILRIGDYYNLYFDALDQRDTDSFAELLRSTVEDEVARKAIAVKLSWFYRYQVETETREFRMLSASIDGISFAQKLVNAIGPAKVMSRTIEFIPQTDGTIFVNDVLPSELDLRDTDIMMGENVLFNVGGEISSGLVNITSSVLEKKIGKPFFHGDSNCSLQDNGKSLIRLNYDGLDLTVEGTCYSHDVWRGRVLSATLRDPKFQLGQGLKVGDPAVQLYAQYPFISIGSRSATAANANGELELKATIENGLVTSLRIALNYP